MYDIIYTPGFCLHNLMEQFNEKTRDFLKRVATLRMDTAINFLGIRLPNGEIILKKGDTKKCPFLPEGQGPFATIKK